MNELIAFIEEHAGDAPSVEQIIGAVVLYQPSLLNDTSFMQSLFAYFGHTSAVDRELARLLDESVVEPGMRTGEVSMLGNIGTSIASLTIARQVNPVTVGVRTARSLLQRPVTAALVDRFLAAETRRLWFVQGVRDPLTGARVFAPRVQPGAAQFTVRQFTQEQFIKQTAGYMGFDTGRRVSFTRTTFPGVQMLEGGKPKAVYAVSTRKSDPIRAYSSIREARVKAAAGAPRRVTMGIPKPKVFEAGVDLRYTSPFVQPIKGRNTFHQTRPLISERSQLFGFLSREHPKATGFITRGGITGLPKFKLFAPPTGGSSWGSIDRVTQAISKDIFGVGFIPRAGVALGSVGFAYLAAKTTEMAIIQRRTAAADIMAEEIAQEVLMNAMAMAPVDSGALRDSISVSVVKTESGAIGSSGVEWAGGPARAWLYIGSNIYDDIRTFARIELYAGAEYAAYVELGTSKMDAQPFLGPAVNQTYQRDVDDVSVGTDPVRRDSSEYSGRTKFVAGSENSRFVANANTGLVGAP